MDKINLFFTTSKSKELKQEFELEYLGIQKWQGDAIIITKGNGKRKGWGAGMYDVKQEHYDYEFYSMLMNLNPPYKISKALDYHYNNYKSEGNDEEVFLLHIEYVILPKVEKYNKTECIKLVQDWISKNKEIMLDKHLQEKVAFLNKAYEIAVEQSPSSPLSYRMGSFEIGKSIGLEENIVKRIMQELVSEGFAETGAQYLFIIITNRGLNFLRSLGHSKSQTLATYNLTVGNNSNLQIQNATQYSSQSISITSTNEQILEFIKELKNGMTVLQQNLSATKFEDLESEISYLEKNLKSSSPKKSLITEVFSNVKEILKGVAVEVIASVFTNGIPS